MNQRETMSKLEAILDDAKAALLATTDEQQHPALRWMTPAVLKWRPGLIYAFTRPHTNKVRHIRQQPQVQWLFQTRALTEIVTIDGAATIIDNPALCNELMENLAPRMTVFWKVDPEHTDLVVLETTIQRASYFRPMKGHREDANL